MGRLTALLCAIALIVACSPPAVSGTLIVQTEEASPEQVAGAAQMLTARFGAVLPTMRSTVSSTVSSTTITFTFRGEAPREEVLRSLAMTRGVLRIALADRAAEAWVTDSDVQNVAMSRTDQGPFISLHLTKEAGDRLLEATTRNMGRTLIATWDGRTILSAPIRAPFGQTFQFSVPSVEQGQVLLNVLRNGGRLPVAVKSFEYRTAPTG